MQTHHHTPLFRRTERLEKIIVTLTALSLVMMLAMLFGVTTHAQPIRVAVKCPTELWQSSLDLLEKQVGVKEATGRNDGRMVKMYLRSTGLPEGNPWCQALQYWTFDSAAKALYGQSAPFWCLPLTRTASTVKAWTQAVKMGVRTLVWPQDGDLVYWRVPGKYQGHVERITKVLQGGWIKTTGGNTGNGLSGSQREGDGCYKRLRNWAHPLGRMFLVGFFGHLNWECVNG